MIAPDLPVAKALPALTAALRASPNAVLVAPPGAGKTTLVPLMLKFDWELRRPRTGSIRKRRAAAA